MKQATYFPYEAERELNKSYNAWEAKQNLKLSKSDVEQGEKLYFPMYYKLLSLNTARKQLKHHRDWYGCCHLVFDEATFNIRKNIREIYNELIPSANKQRTQYEEELKTYRLDSGKKMLELVKKYPTAQLLDPSTYPEQLNTELAPLKYGISIYESAIENLTKSLKDYSVQIDNLNKQVKYTNEDQMNNCLYLNGKKENSFEDYINGQSNYLKALKTYEENVSKLSSEFEALDKAYKSWNLYAKYKQYRELDAISGNTNPGKYTCNAGMAGSRCCTPNGYGTVKYSCFNGSKRILYQCPHQSQNCKSDYKEYQAFDYPEETLPRYVLTCPNPK